MFYSAFCYLGIICSSGCNVNHWFFFLEVSCELRLYINGGKFHLRREWGNRVNPPPPTQSYLIPGFRYAFRSHSNY